MKRHVFFIIAIIITATLMSAELLATDSPIEIVKLKNAGFEEKDQAPWYWWGEAGTGTYGVSEVSHGGKKSIKMVADKGDYIPMGFLQDFDCRPGDEVTVTAWIMSPVSSPLTNSNAFIRLEFWGGEPFNVIKNYESPHLTGVFNWTKSEVSGQAPDGTTKIKIGLFIWNPGTDHSGTVYFDDAKVSRKGPVLF